MNKYLFLLMAVFVMTLSCNKEAEDNGNNSNENSGSSDDYTLLLQELNAARTNPAAYAKIIETAYLPYYEGTYLKIPGALVLITNEGKAACEEAISFMKEQSSMAALELNTGLNKAAQNLCNEQSKSGDTGHFSADGKAPKDRMQLFGTFSPAAWACGESISYGSPSARRAVIDMLIDDGVNSRGHRTTLMSGNWTHVGFGWASHPTYRTMYVMDFAAGYAAD
ncbi:MAG: CAP domain-containing protein [Bacteroidales bacterium]|jgi:uncharacterized protein YkwD|nr:CAP domain-containing protein [Bacteroidales bacterium]